MDATTQKREANREENAKPKLDSLFEELSSRPNGLSGEDAKKRLEKFGLNALEGKKQRALLKFLGYAIGIWSRSSRLDHSAEEENAA
jgi:hypothetical protein